MAIEDYLYDDLFGLLIKDYLPYAHAIVFSMVSKRMKRLYEAFLIVERPPLFHFHSLNPGAEPRRSYDDFILGDVPYTGKAMYAAQGYIRDTGRLESIIVHYEHSLTALLVTLPREIVFWNVLRREWCAM